MSGQIVIHVYIFRFVHMLHIIHAHRETERETHTERQRDTHTERQTGRQTDRERETVRARVVWAFMSIHATHTRASRHACATGASA